VWNEGTLIKDYPPEAYDIKCMEDTWEYLKTENAVAKFEGYIRGWMKQIQELLLESEQLRLETDDAGPQVCLLMTSHCMGLFIDVHNDLTLFKGCY
jgi:hypothetical protein